LIGFFLVFLIPYAIFYYTADDDDSVKSPAGIAFLYMGIVVIIFGIFSGVGYVYLGYAEIPVEYMTSQLVDGNYQYPLTYQCSDDNTCTANSKTMEFKIPLMSFIISAITLISYLFFMIFGGIGFISAPLDLMEAYIYRPRPINRESYIERKLYISNKVKRLIEDGLRIRDDGVAKKLTNKWKKDVYLLDESFKENEIAFKKKGGPLILYIIQLILGIVCLILTITWLIHIIIWPLLDVYPFLNYLFIALDGAASFIGTLFYGIFAFYLLFCVMRGNFKFGIRIPAVFAVHPLKIEGTLTTGILINGGLLLLCSVSVVKFCTDSFSLYARLTVVNSIFDLVITNLRYLRYFWMYYYVGIIGITLISFIYFLAKPLDKEKKAMLKAQKERRKMDKV